MAFVQRASNQDFTGTGNAAPATGNFGSAITAGNLIVFSVVWFGDAETLAITDTLGNTYTEIGSMISSGSGDRMRAWYTISGSGGTNSVTCTSSTGNLEWWGVVAEEYGDIAGTGTLIGQSGQQQATPTTATDAVSSTAAAPSAQPCWQWGISHNCALGGSTPAAGTGFTGNAALWSNNARTEAVRRTSTASVAATFTAASNEQHVTKQAFFLEEVAEEDFTLPVDPAGALTLTPRTLTLATSIGVTSASLVLTPQDITLTATGVDDFVLAVDSGDVTLTGQEIPFVLTVPWTPASLTLTPQDITLTATGLNSFTLAVDSSDITLTGNDVSLLFEENFSIAVDSIPLSLSPQDITLTLSVSNDFVLAIDRGFLTLTGQNIDLVGPIQVIAGGHGSVMRNSKVVVVSATGRTKWKDYIPVKIVTPAQSDVNTYNFLGALGVEVLSSGVGLQEWVDYIPVVEVVDSDATRWRTDNSGWIPIVEIS